MVALALDLVSAVAAATASTDIAFTVAAACTVVCFVATAIAVAVPATFFGQRRLQQGGRGWLSLFW